MTAAVCVGLCPALSRSGPEAPGRVSRGSAGSCHLLRSGLSGQAARGHGRGRAGPSRACTSARHAHARRSVTRMQTGPALSCGPSALLGLHCHLNTAAAADWMPRPEPDGPEALHGGPNNADGGRSGRRAPCPLHRPPPAGRTRHTRTDRPARACSHSARLERRGQGAPGRRGPDGHLRTRLPRHARQGLQLRPVTGLLGRPGTAARPVQPDVSAEDRAHRGLGRSI